MLLLNLHHCTFKKQIWICYQKASWEGEGEIQDTGDKKVKGGDKKEGIKDLEGSIKEEGSA